MQFNKGKFNRIDGKTYLATATLLGSGKIVTTAIRVRISGGNFVGKVDYEGLAHIVISVDIQINGLGVYNVKSIRVQLNTANIIGEGNITGIPAIWLYASSELTGAFDVMCRAEGQGIAIVKAEILGSGDILPLPFAIRYSQSTYKGLGMLYGYPHRTTFPTVEVSGEGNIISNINMTTFTYVDLIGKGDIHATTISIILTNGELTGLSNVEAFGGILWEALTNLSGSGIIQASGVRGIIANPFINGKGEIIAIPYAVYMPPFMTIPTRFLIIDTVTLAVIEDTVTRIEFEDNQTKVVFI